MGHFDQAQLSSITLSFLTVTYTVEHFYFWCFKSDFDAVKKNKLDQYEDFLSMGTT